MTAGICVVAMLTVVCALQGVFTDSASGDAQRETERIKVDTHEETQSLLDETASSDTEPTQETTVAKGDTIDVENNKVISLDKAKEIALADAGYEETQVTMSRIRYEWDDGIQIYDVEFYSGGLEYEYEIDAKSGDIIEKDIDD